MTITQGKAVTAYKTLLRMAALPLPLPAAFGLHRLRRALEPSWQFQLEQEERLLRDCGGEALPDGSVRFPEDRTEARDRFVQAMRELSQMPVEIACQPPVLDERTPGLSLTMNDLAALEGLVQFERNGG